MFCDLTSSSTLFQELNVSAAVQHINEYLQVVCDVAFSHGATVDKYMGDGALFVSMSRDRWRTIHGLPLKPRPR